MLKKLVVIVNALNIVDTIQTHICINSGLCVEWNKLLYNPLALYVVKPLVILKWSIALYYIVSRSRGAVSITAKAMLILLTLILLTAVVNNTLVLLHLGA